MAQFHSLAFRHSAQEQNRNPPTPRPASSQCECWSGPGCYEAKGQGLAQDSGNPSHPGEALMCLRIPSCAVEGGKIGE